MWVRVLVRILVRVLFRACRNIVRQPENIARALFDN